MDNRSRWIWAKGVSGEDIYADFADKFEYSGGGAQARISADSNYALYINGEFVFAGQYADFPHWKIYDEIDVSEFCHEGENSVFVTVWHYGRGNMGYYPGNAAVRFEVISGGDVVCASGADTLSRKNPGYVAGLSKNITGQLGFSYKYDMTAGEIPFEESIVVEQELPLFPRPVKRPVIKEEIPSALIGGDGRKHFLFDLGREEAGLLSVKIYSETEQDILIAYGEHIVDGGVRRIISSRDFSVEMRLKAGMNEFFNPFRRLGGRYLEIFAENPIAPEKATLRPVEYPLEMRPAPKGLDELQKKIYDTCVRTLHLCMHEHYEDTPWREQALYAMDSRNQMLCGYYAFGEYEFPRGNLYLMSKDDRADGLLSICTPSKDDLTIPSFSLHYFTEVCEYTKYSGDVSLIKEIWDKLVSVLSAFSEKAENDLIPVFEEKCHWNFYEWAEGLSGKLFGVDEKRFDMCLNCLYSLALTRMADMADILGIENDYRARAERTNIAIYKTFRDEKTGLFRNSTEDESASELANALGILSGAVTGDEAMALAEKLAQKDNGLTPATLSMLCFKYDALLMADREKYRDYILSDISARYEKMLAAGATSFWETELGEKDFDDAGSLCHGWSAMPVYYYHTLMAE